MRLFVQRVKSASVSKVSTKEIIGRIDLGLFVLVGFKKTDTKQNADILAHKLSKIRLMADEEEKMNKTVTDAKGQVLVVSQFTLYANTKDGNRPSFIDAMDPSSAKKLYEYFVNKLISLNLAVETGSFGDYMQIETILDGPVTIVLES